MNHLWANSGCHSNVTQRINLEIQKCSGNKMRNPVELKSSITSLKLLEELTSEETKTSVGWVIFLRSTKWNANLILLRDYAELVALCKVIVWKTHIPVRTHK